MVFPKILFSCQQDEPIPPGLLWALAGWHSMGCIILSPGSAAAQGTPGLLSVVFILLLEALQDKLFAVFPFTLLVLSATLLSSSGSPGRVPGVLLAQIPEVWCKQQQKQQRLDQLDHSCQLICFWCCIKTRLTLHMTRIIYDVFPTFTSPPLVHNPLIHLPPAELSLSPGSWLSWDMEARKRFRIRLKTHWLQRLGNSAPCLSLLL